MIRLFLCFAVVTLCLSCSDVGSPVDREPDWVQQMIRDFEAAPVGNPPQSIWKYEYLGSTVYYVPPQCCDQFSDLYDVNGNLLCHPDGGIGGAGDHRCSDFRQNRQNEVLIWQDPRGR